MLTLLKNYKPLMYIAGVILLLSSLTVAYSKIWKNGYNTAEVKFMRDAAVAASEAVKTARAEWVKSAAAATAQLKEEELIRQEVEVNVKQIIKVIEVEVPAACHDLGPSIKQLFNDAIKASGNSQGGSASDPAGADS